MDGVLERGAEECHCVLFESARAWGAVKVHRGGGGESAEDLGSLVGEFFMGWCGRLGLIIFVMGGRGGPRGGGRGGGGGGIGERQCRQMLGLRVFH